MGAIYTFSGNKMSANKLRSQLPPTGVVLVENNNMNHAILTMLRNLNINRRLLIEKTYRNPYANVPQASYAAVKVMEKDGKLYQTWILIGDRFLITVGEKAAIWKKIEDRIRSEASTKTMTPSHLLLLLLEEVYENNGTLLENLWKQKNRGKDFQTLSTMLKEEHALLEAMGKGKLKYFMPNLPLKDLLQDMKKTTSLRKSLVEKK